MTRHLQALAGYPECCYEWLPVLYEMLTEYWPQQAFAEL
jgi:hypothetical protein